jgi:hypothetical protein
VFAVAVGVGTLSRQKGETEELGAQSVSKLIVGSKAFFWVSSVAASKKSNREKYLRLTLH